jgi:hypothetical protein
VSSTGWYPRRRGAGDHLASARISLFDDGLHDFLCMNAQARVDPSSKTPPGVWIGSARKIWLLTGRQGTEREIQRSLQKLERIGWIKRWIKSGQRGDYPILIAKFVVTGPRQKAQNSEEVAAPISAPTKLVVNAKATTDWQHPILEPAPNSDEVLSPLLQEVKNLKRTQHPKNRGADPRFKPIVEHYYEGQRKAGIEPNCDRSDFGALGSWLKKNPGRSLESIAASLSNALGSTDHFPLRPGFRLREFLEHESKYQRGPLLKNDPRQVRPITSAPRNELSVSGSQKVKAYGVAS